MPRRRRTSARRKRWARRVVGALAIVGAIAVVALVYVAITWPDVGALANANPSTTAFIDQYRAGQREQGLPAEVVWHWVESAAISPHLKRAVVSAEDMEFFQHNGFSKAELQAALKEALESGEAPRGASTITQQLAKNLWLSPSRSLLRKLKEAVLTWQLERHLTKQRILELYLNIVELGPGIYGAEAAAWRYFSMPASSLSEHQSAQLAAGLPRPKRWHPGVESPSYRSYVEEILRRMDVAEFLWRYVGEGETREGQREDG